MESRGVPAPDRAVCRDRAGLDRADTARLFLDQRFLSPTDKRNDFDFITILKRLIVFFLADQSTVQLDRDLLRREIKRSHQLSDGGGLGDLAIVAVDFDDHAIGVSPAGWIEGMLRRFEPSQRAVQYK
jgi:hypothetical protein